MKIISFLLFVCCVQAAAKGYAQKVTLNLENVPVQKVFTELSRQTGISVVFSEAQLNGLEKVSINVKDATIQEVLDLCLKNQPLSYKMENDLIVINKTPSGALRYPALDPPPPITVRGKILNENGEPVVASVTVKGQSFGVSTDAEGFFVLNNVDENAQLIITATNIETLVVSVNGQKNLNIAVKMSTASLNEVVVNKGYYTERQRLSTGNVSRVTSKDIQGQPVTSPLLALQGRVPGLEITLNNSSPGVAPKIQIRGNNSLRADGSYPLYVVDGVIIESASIKSRSLSYGAGIDPLNNISPENIESIEVLKDADATAIYGSRGANGVILVTTKKGKQSGVHVNLGAYRGTGKIGNRVDLLDTKQFLEMRKEAFADAGMTPSPTFDYDLTRWDSTKYTDWQKVLIGGSSRITDFQLSLEGGSETTSFRLGGSYHKETMIISDDLGFRNVNVFSNFNHRSRDKRFLADFTASYGVSNNNYVALAPFINSALKLSPNAPDLYLPDGSLNWDIIDYGTAKVSAFANPLAEMQKINKFQTRTLIANSNISYELIEGLQIKANLGYTATDGNEHLITPIAALAPISRTSQARGAAVFGNSGRNSWIIEPQLSWSKKLAKGIFNALIGSTFQENVGQAQFIIARDYTSDMLLGSMAGATELFSESDNYSAYKYTAVFARVAYNHNRKYLVNLTGRRDGSSRFGPGNRFGNFGAVGAAWIFSEEEFIKRNLPVVSFGKLRTSYGVTGNDQIPDYQYYSLFNIAPVTYQRFITLSPAGLFDRNFKWETTRKFEGSLELGLFRDRISLQGTWFRNRSSNQLVSYQLPTTTGFNSVLKNFDATIQNTGWEFIMQSTNIQSSKFNWNTSLNLTIARNKLVAFPGIENSPYKETYQVGSPLSIQYLYVWKGVDPNTGIHAVEDINGDGVFDNNDKRFDRSLSTDFFGGIQNTLQLGGFDLSFLFQFSKRNFVLPDWDPPGADLGNKPLQVLSRWKKPGDQTDITKSSSDFMVGYYYGLAYNSNYSVTDGSFIRLKDMAIGYRVPGSIIRKLKIADCRLFLHGQNLVTLTNYFGLDPETGLSIPQLRTITGGINFKF